MIYHWSISTLKSEFTSYASKCREFDFILNTTNGIDIRKHHQTLHHHHCGESVTTRNIEVNKLNSIILLYA